MGKKKKRKSDYSKTTLFFLELAVRRKETGKQDKLDKRDNRQTTKRAGKILRGNDANFPEGGGEGDDRKETKELEGKKEEGM